MGFENLSRSLSEFLSKRERNLKYLGILLWISYWIIGFSILEEISMVQPYCSYLINQHGTPFLQIVWYCYSFGFFHNVTIALLLGNGIMGPSLMYHYRTWTGEKRSFADVKCYESGSFMTPKKNGALVIALAWLSCLMAMGMFVISPNNKIQNVFLVVIVILAIVQTFYVIKLRKMFGKRE